MEEALGHTVPVEMSQDAGAAHPGGVGDDRDREGRQHEYEALPRLLLADVGIEDRQRQKGYQGPDARAGLRHLEGRVGQDDDVPFPKDRYPDHVHEPRGHLRGEELHREGDLLHEDRRNGDHEDEVGQREHEHLQEVPPEQKKDRAPEDDDQGKPHREKFRGKRPQEEHHRPEDNQRQPRPVARGNNPCKVVSTLPDEVKGDGRDQEAVGEVGHVDPVIDERPQDREVKQADAGGNEGENSKEFFVQQWHGSPVTDWAASSRC